jgi:CheY-like chemotaxis protein
MATSVTVSRHILVVDDDPMVADSIRRLLEFDGHSVEIAGSGEEALATFAREIFDLTLLDYEMPQMKGDQLAVALKAAAPKHPIIMFTGYAEAVGGATVPMPGVDLVLGKPFDLERLRQTIASLFPSV